VRFEQFEVLPEKWLEILILRKTQPGMVGGQNWVWHFFKLLQKMAGYLILSMQCRVVKANP